MVDYLTQAFNFGYDAFIAGVPKTSNPIRVYRIKAGGDISAAPGGLEAPWDRGWDYAQKVLGS